MSLIGTDEHYPFDLDQLPPSWEAVFVGDAIAEIQPGFASGAHNQEGKGIIHLRPMNVDRQGRLDLSNSKYVLDLDGLRVRQGDVVFNNTNSPELIGKTTSIDKNVEFAFSNHMTRLRLPDGLSAKFVANQLHCLWMLGYFRHICTNHVNQASISSSTLSRRVPLIIPPTEEQHRIVAEIEKQFTRLDAAVASLRRVQANLKRYRAAVLKAACEGRLVETEAALARAEQRPYESAAELLKRVLRERRARWEADQLAKMEAAGKPPKDDKWKAKYDEPAAPNTSTLPELPEGWTWARVAQLGDVQLGRQRAPQHHTGPNIRKYLRVANVFEDRLDLSDVKSMNFEPQEFENYRLEYGDILLNEGQSLELVGRPAMFRDELKDVCFQNTLVRFRSAPRKPRLRMGRNWVQPTQ